MKPTWFAVAVLFLLNTAQSQGSLAEVGETARVSQSVPSAVSGFRFSDAERVVQINGRDSITQDLTMGPDATDFWRKVQILAKHNDWLEDFSNIVQLFDLSITDPIDSVSSTKVGLQQRHDLKGRPLGYIISRGDYGIARDFYESSKRQIQLNLNLNTDGICLSASEVKKVFGDGLIGVAIDSATSTERPFNTAGLSFSEAYGVDRNFSRRANIVFSYAYSGCVASIKFEKPASN